VGFSFYVAVGWITLAGALAIAAIWLRRGAPTGLRVLARLPIEPRRSLLVIEVAERVLLLSSSEAGLSLLVELDPAQAAAFAAAPSRLPEFFLLRRG
jgi:flagellar biogenesis protein FliO